jgi:hypothetical protein
MRNSPRFALDVLACAALGMILWAACAGVGYRILPGRPAPAPAPDPDLEPASWRQPGIAASAGLGLLLFLGGIGVAAEIPWWLIVVPFLAVGLGLTIWEVSRLDRSTHLSRTVLVIGGLGAAAFFLVALVEALPGLRFPLNLCDDTRAYLPLAHRLIDTNGLVDPWNARRLQNLGGFTFLQALPVSVFGNAGIGVVETVVAAIFLAGLFVANGFRSTWARLVSVGFILAIPFLWVPRVNTTGVLMGSPLLVAVLGITVELRKALRAGDRSAAVRWAVAGGLVTAAVTSVRPNLGVLSATVLGLGALLTTGVPFISRLRALGAAAAGTFVAVLPWSVASWRTVGTPFFPLFTGNQNRAAVAHESADGLRDLADQAWSLMRAGPYLWVALGVLVVALMVRKILPDVQAVVIPAVVTCGFIVGFAFVEYFAAAQAVIRYVAPASEGLAVFFVYEVIRGVDARQRTGAPEVRGWLPPALAVVAAVVLAAVGYSTLTVEAPAPASGARFIERAARNELRPFPGYEVSTPALRRAYRRALARVDADRTIAAVDRPYLIDVGRYDIANLDLPGFTAPDARFPFFSGPAAKIARLRRAGFDTLLATVPDTEICLAPAVLRVQVAQRTRAYAASARYYLDWEDDIAAIAARAPDAVNKVGPLLVIDLRRAQRDLAAPGA